MEIIWQFDNQVFRAINQSLNSPVLDPFFWLITSLGLGWVQVLLVGTLFFRPRLRKTAWAALIALGFSSIILHIIKATVHRLRPTNLQETIIHPPEMPMLSSFPSGHATSSFAIAVTIAMLWPGNRRFAGVLLISMATLIGISRIYRGVHWPTDVIAGAALGFACGATVALNFGELGKKK